MISYKEVILLNKYQVLDKIKTEDKKALAYLKETINYLKKETTYKDDHRDIRHESKIDFDKVIIVSQFVPQINSSQTQNSYLNKKTWMSLYCDESFYNCKNPFYFDIKLDDRLHLTTSARGCKLNTTENEKIGKSHILIQECFMGTLDINILFDITELYNELFPPNILRSYKNDIIVICC